MATITADAVPHELRRSKFFVGMSIALFLIVLVGFSRTLYLRAFFPVPPIPPHVYVHGAILTAWFAWFCLQTSLVAVGRSDLHRRLGIVGAGIGIAVIIANVSVLLGIGPRLRVALQSGHIDPAFVIGAIWGDFASLIAFAGFLSVGLAFRRHPEFHKRLMFLASMSIVGPALGRIMQWTPFFRTHNLNLPAAGLLFFLGGLVIYDLVTTRRVHPVTIWGGALRLLLWIGARSVATTAWGVAVARGMT